MTAGEQVVTPDRHRPRREKQQRYHGPRIREEAAAGERGQRLGDASDEREEHHVHDRVAVEPEDVLVGDIPAVAREQAGLDPRKRDDAHGGQQEGEAHQHHEHIDELGPGEHWHPHQRDPGRPHAQDRPQNAGALQDHPEGDEEHARGPQGHSVAGRAVAVGQRRVSPPAVGGAADRGHEIPDQQQAAEHVQPVSEQCRAGGRDSRRPDLERDQVHAEPERQRRHHGLDHAGAVLGHELEVLLRAKDVQAGLGELDTHGAGQRAVDQEENQGGPDRQDADTLVVRAQQPLPEALALLFVSRARVRHRLRVGGHSLPVRRNVLKVATGTARSQKSIS